MNTLTWFLYFIHITEQLRGVAIFLIVVGILCLGIGRLAVGMKRDEISRRDEEEGYDGGLARWWFWFKSWTVIASVALFVLVFVPGKDTMYMMAASELGGMIANHEITQELAKELYATLKQGLVNLAAPPE